MFAAFKNSTWDILFKSALVRLPRLAPTQSLYLTDPEGPFPVILDLSSRGSYKIPVYIWIPKHISAAEAERLPVVIDFHGGGFYLGSCLEQAPFCSKLARELGAVVLSVDYRMGPVDKFPAALEDADDVVKAVLEPSSRAGMQLRAAVREQVLRNAMEKKEARKAEKAAREAKKEARRTERRAEKKTKKDAKKAEKAERKKKHLDVETASIASLDVSPISSSASSILPAVTPAKVDLDKTRICFSGASSGGNIALNLGMSLTHPGSETPWPSAIPADYKHQVPLLLLFPSFDARQLPSERTKPPHLPVSSPFWSGISDLLAPTYLPRDQAAHHRASPGLAPVESIHESARMLLILTGKDSLAEQSEAWVEKMEQGSRAKDLRTERYPNQKHGWAVFPEAWLGTDERAKRNDALDKSVDFVRRIWVEDESALEPHTQSNE